MDGKWKWWEIPVPKQWVEGIGFFETVLTILKHNRIDTDCYAGGGNYINSAAERSTLVLP